MTKISISQTELITEETRTITVIAGPEAEAEKKYGEDSVTTRIVMLHIGLIEKRVSTLETLVSGNGDLFMKEEGIQGPDQGKKPIELITEIEADQEATRDHIRAQEDTPDLEVDRGAEVEKPTVFMQEAPELPLTRQNF